MTMGSGVPWAESGDTDSSDGGPLPYQYQAVGDLEEACEFLEEADFGDCNHPEFFSWIESQGTIFFKCTFEKKKQ